MTRNRPYRQGDVWLIPVDRAPAGTVAARDGRGRLVLAEGEVTGHAHVIDAPAAEATLLTTEQNERFLRLVAGAQLVHEEHATLDLPKGDYRVVIQEEWSDELEQHAAARSR